MSLADDALRDVVMKTLADDIEEAIKKGRSDLGPGMRAQKIKTLIAELPDGTEVATLSYVGSRDAPRITDPAKFLAWVAANRPGEIETRVRESYQEALLKAISAAGRPVDPQTGEVVPGVEFGPTTPYVTPSFAKGETPGRERIRQAWRAGDIDLREMLALPAAEGDAP
jgi:hypothetical protein